MRWAALGNRAGVSAPGSPHRLAGAPPKPHPLCMRAFRAASRPVLQPDLCSGCSSPQQRRPDSIARIAEGQVQARQRRLRALHHMQMFRANSGDPKLSVLGAGPTAVMSAAQACRSSRWEPSLPLAGACDRFAHSRSRQTSPALAPARRLQLPPGGGRCCEPPAQPRCLCWAAAGSMASAPAAAAAAGAGRASNGGGPAAAAGPQPGGGQPHRGRLVLGCSARAGIPGVPARAEHAGHHLP